MVAITGLSVDCPARCHATPGYAVFAVGSRPGYCCLGTLDLRVQTPRRMVLMARPATGPLTVARSRTGGLGLGGATRLESRRQRRSAPPRSCATPPCPRSSGVTLRPATLDAAITPARSWVILKSPSHPTGAACAGAQLRGRGKALLRQPQVPVLCSEVCDRIWHADFPPCAIIGAAAAGAGGQSCVDKSRDDRPTDRPCRGTARPDCRDQQAAIADVVLPLIDQPGGGLCADCRRAELAGSAEVYRQRRARGHGLVNARPGLRSGLPNRAFHLYPYGASLIGKTEPDGTPLRTDPDVSIYPPDEAGIAPAHRGADGLGPHLRISTGTSRELVEAARARPR